MRRNEWTRAEQIPYFAWSGNSRWSLAPVALVTTKKTRSDVMGRSMIEKESAETQDIVEKRE